MHSARLGARSHQLPVDLIVKLWKDHENEKQGRPVGLRGIDEMAQDNACEGTQPPPFLESPAYSWAVGHLAMPCCHQVRADVRVRAACPSGNHELRCCLLAAITQAPLQVPGAMTLALP